jgi:hypothetical protein
MNVNPEVVRFDDGYGIRYTRNNWRVLVWVQDLTARKMKSELGMMHRERPIVMFPTRLEAEAEVRKTVIPYLIAEKDVPPEDIIGW